MTRAEQVIAALREQLADLAGRGDSREQQRREAEDSLAERQHLRAQIAARVSALPSEISAARVGVQMALDTSLEDLNRERLADLERELGMQTQALRGAEDDLIAAQDDLAHAESTARAEQLEDDHLRAEVQRDLLSAEANLQEARAAVGWELLDVVRSGAQVMATAVADTEMAAADARQRQEEFRREARAKLAAHPAALMKAEAVLRPESNVERCLKATATMLAVWEQCWRSLESQTILWGHKGAVPVFWALSAGMELPAVFRGERPDYFHSRRLGVEEMLAAYQAQRRDQLGRLLAQVHQQPS